MTQQLPQGFTVGAPADTDTDLPGGFALNAPAEDREDTPEALKESKGIFESFSEWFTGEGRNTRDLKNLPTIVNSGFLQGESPANVAKVAMLTSLTNDPNELANIIQKQIPGVRVQYNKDAKGNIYPILINPSNGQVAAVDKPGADLMNLGQFMTQALAFAAGGPGKSQGIKAAFKIGGQEAAKETVLQGTQALAGGDIDAGDIVASGVLGGGLSGIGSLFKSIKMGATGIPKQETLDILSAADELNIPVMTSDIYNPQNWLTRGVQLATETMPVVGTGNLRVAQQGARQQALDDFVSLYRGGSYEEVIREVGKKNKQLRDATSEVYNKVNPYLDQLSKEGGVPLNQAQGELDSLTSHLLTPGLDVPDSAFAMADDLEQALSSGNQSFQVLKDNISAWHEKINGLDPNNRPMPSKIKARFEKVLTAARGDRDSFAKANLSDVDYTALKGADAAWGEMIKDMSSSKMKAVLDKGDITPEVARNMLFSRNKSDVERIYSSLTPSGQSSARAAFVTQIAEDLSKKKDGLSPTSFSTAMNRYKDGIDVLFQGERKKEVQGLINAFDVTSRAQEVVRGQGSQTAERLIGVGAIGGTAGGAIPLEALTAYATVGGLARIMESPRMRNILVKMNGVDPASKTAQNLTRQLNNLLGASLQANPLKGTSEYEREISEELRSQNNQIQGAQ